MRALEALHGGHAEQWVALHEARGQLHIHAGPDAGTSGIEHAAELYLEALERHQPEDLYLLAGENAVGAAVNERVREQLVDRGVIVEAGEIDGRRFAVGERITLRENGNDKNLANGMRATILAVDALNGSLTVAIDGKRGGVATLEYEYVTGRTEGGQECVQGGYANTIHTSQGATVNETIIVGPAQGLDQERGYVAASRARHATHLITWDGSAPEYFAEHERATAGEAQEVREQLVDALERTGVEMTATEQIAEAGEQLQLELGAVLSAQLAGERDTRIHHSIGQEPASDAAADAAQMAESDPSERRVETESTGAAHTTGGQDWRGGGEAPTERSVEPGDEPRASTREHADAAAVETSANREQEIDLERARGLTVYHTAVATVGAERHRELEALREHLETAQRRLQASRDEFEATNLRAAQVGELADRLERTFPTGYGTPSAKERLSHYQHALERLAAATKRKDIKQQTETARAIRASLPASTR